MRKLFSLLALVGASCLWSAGAAAQTKVAWSDSCSKADPITACRWVIPIVTPLASGN